MICRSNFKLQYISLYICFGVLALIPTSCTGEPEPPEPTGIIGIGMRTGVQLEQTSRAGEPPLNAVDPLTVGVFSVMENDNGYVFNNQKFYNAEADLSPFTEIELPANATLKSTIEGWLTKHNPNRWAYYQTKKWTPNRNYQFYAYSPWTPTEDLTIETLSFNGIKRIVWSNLPPISQFDYVVADNVVQVASGITPMFQMEHHISSRVCFRFKILEEYNKLRDIEITDVVVEEGTLSSTYYKCTIDLSGVKADLSINQSTSAYVPEPCQLLPEFSSIPTAVTGPAGGLKLPSAEYILFSSVYVIPRYVTSLTATVTYNVYDKKGTLTRKNQQVKNTVFIEENLLPGSYFNINILIAPDYLYVLSDNDPDASMVINP